MQNTSIILGLGLAILLSFHQSVMAKTPAQNRSNLYVFFDDRAQTQKIAIEFSGANNATQKIECSFLSKKKDSNSKNHPTCGFGFSNTPVTISNITYKLKNGDFKSICQDLNGKQFTHGKLVIFSKKPANQDKSQCTLKETH